MPDLLLELLSEEIPARMQRRAADDLRRLVTDGLVEAGLTYEGAKAFVTPRRLALTVHGLTARSADINEEKKGPRVDAPAKAIEGFLRSAVLASIEEAKIQSDPKKGDFYVAEVKKPGRPAEEIIAEILPAMIRSFPWPKSMRWGARSAPAESSFAGTEGEGSASLRWVRPLRSILCTFGPETEEPIVVDFEVAGIAAGNLTFGHRFMHGGKPIKVRRFADYEPSLQAAKVVLDHDRRQAIIAAEAKNLAFAQGLDIVEDAGLLEEVAGLVEWPVVLVGSFDERFLDIPGEVIRLTIRQNQKCFVVRRTSGAPDNLPLAGRSNSAEGDVREGVRRSATPLLDRHDLPDGKSGRSILPRKGGDSGGAPLAPRFILVANIEAKDGGKEIVAGNERVIAARLSDARFFWEQDLKTPLEKHAEKLATITFHEKLGTQAERVERIARLARELAPIVGADPDDADRAARLAKADLPTAMVGEFPELQGVMGRYYALKQGEKPNVADAIRDHYKPQGPEDSVPTEPVAVAVALADKLDMLVGFWAIDEKPTGSKDPYALRRAALGVIRVVLGGEISLHLLSVLMEWFWILLRAPKNSRSIALPGDKGYTFSDIRLLEEDRLPLLMQVQKALEAGELWLARVQTAPFSLKMGAIDEAALLQRLPSPATITRDLLTFFADRLKVHLRETGARHDLIDAVFSNGTDAGSKGARSSPHQGEGGVRSAPGEGAGRTTTPSPASALRSSATSPRGGEERSPSGAVANDDLLMIVRRVEALGKFLDTDDGKNLLVGYRRAANILRAEEKKDGEGAFTDLPDPLMIGKRGQREEADLYDAMQVAEQDARDQVEREDFEGAMRALAKLRPAVDSFFDHVTVNTDDPELRKNRLRLLNQLRRATLAVADFSKIGG